MRRILSTVAGVMLAALVACSAQAEQWGDLTMTFTYEGSRPEPPEASITKDKAFCGRFDVVDESLLVSEENNGVQNVIVSLYVGRGEDPPAIHPDYKESANDTIKLDNEKCRFAPHVAVLRTSQTLKVLNSDPIGHNTNFTTFRNPAQNLLIPAKGNLELNFSAAEPLPAKVACNIHPWMTGWLVIKDHPYVAVSDEDGKVVIKNVPAGERTFQVWHEKAGYVSTVKVDDEETEWNRGRVEVEIESGENDLGEVVVFPDLFE